MKTTCRFISDSHTHSRNSFDGNDSVIMMCEKAFNLGLYSITITDHCECHDNYIKNFRDSICSSIKETSRARATYYSNDSGLRVYTGIELGQPTQDQEAAKDALSLAEYDFVLGSLHNLRGEEDFYFLRYNEENVPGLLNRYFDELLELAEEGDFDSLAHLTYPLRYVYGAGIDPHIKNYSEKIDAVLLAVIKNHHALEINTSGLRQKIRKTLPNGHILRRYRELGGKFVTLGSDAHRWADIGSGIETGLELLQECGFTYFTVYEKREPQLLPIK